MAFGYEDWKTTPAGIEAACAIRCKAAEVIAAAQNGSAPIRVISPAVAHHLGDRHNNSHTGRLIREWLGPTFRVAGRIKWPRENGTESGAVYRQAA